MLQHVDQHLEVTQLNLNLTYLIHFNLNLNFTHLNLNLNFIHLNLYLNSWVQGRGLNNLVAYAMILKQGSHCSKHC